MYANGILFSCFEFIVHEEETTSQVFKIYTNKSHFDLHMNKWGKQYQISSYFKRQLVEWERARESQRLYTS